MGQLVFGIIFGIEITDDDDVDDLIDRWEEEMKEEIAALSNHPSLEEYEIGRYRIVPDISDEHEVLGFWIAVGGSGVGGIPFLEGPISFASFLMDARYTTALERAKERWSRFAQWAESQGTLLPAPEIWLAETEVA